MKKIIIYLLLTLELSYFSNAQDNKASIVQKGNQISHFNLFMPYKTHQFIKKGDTIEFVSKGRIYLRKNVYLKPSGISNQWYKNEKIFFKYLYGRLLAKVGTSIIDVGQRKQVISSTDGELVLFPNMTKLKGYQGFFQVQIRINGKLIKFTKDNFNSENYIIKKLDSVENVKKFWLSCDSLVIAGWNSLNKILFWDAKNGEFISELLVAKKKFIGFQFMKNLPFLIGLTKNNFIYIYDLSTGELINSYDIPFKNINKWSFSSDGSYLAFSYSYDTRISGKEKLIICDIKKLLSKTAKESFFELKLKKDFRNIDSILFFENNKKLLVAATLAKNPYSDEGHNIIIFNTSSWKPRINLPLEHSKSVKGVTFNYSSEIKASFLDTDVLEVKIFGYKPGLYTPQEPFSEIFYLNIKNLQKISKPSNNKIFVAHEDILIYYNPLNKNILVANEGSSIQLLDYEAYKNYFNSLYD